MSTVATGYGLKPLNLIGGQAYNGGVIREIKVAANNAAAIFNGDLVVLSTAGQPSAVTTTPTAGTTAGIVGVMVGARYVNAATKQPVWSNFLPANVITGGGSEVWIQVMDDPDALFQIKGNAAFGTFNSSVGTTGSGWPGAIGKNAALAFGSGGSTSTGVSSVVLKSDANAGALLTTNTFAMRVVDIVQGTESETYPEFIVKFNLGVHSYYFSLGV
jgi:hypothetical protein